MVAVSGEAVFDRIAQTHRLIAELEPILQSLMLNDATIIDGLAQLLGTQQLLHNRTDEHLESLAADIRDMSATMLALADRANGPAKDDRPDIDPGDPEIGLLAHLLPLLPNPILLDVGANVGNVAHKLIEAGFEIYAFEPFPASFAALERIAAGAPDRLHAFPLAIGAQDGSAELFTATDRSAAGDKDTSLYHSIVPHPMMEGLEFSGSQKVEMRTLENLIRDAGVPADAAVLKIDTEGADLDVIRGAGDRRFAVVVTEFWDRRHAFGVAGHGNLNGLVTEMRQRGYPWHLVLYRLDESGELGCLYNIRSPVPTSWGNAIFFRDFSLFSAAALWSRQAFGSRP